MKRSSMTNFQSEKKILIYKFSNGSKIIRIIAWQQRFINNFRTPRYSRKYSSLDIVEIM